MELSSSRIAEEFPFPCLKLWICKNGGKLSWSWNNNS